MSSVPYTPGRISSPAICDGERWHTSEGLQRDLEHQAILERLGWAFVRIRGSLFFRDPATAMAPVFARLEQFGIEPLGAEGGLPDDADSSATVERIRRKAEPLRLRWQEEKQSHIMNGDQKR